MKFVRLSEKMVSAVKVLLDNEMTFKVKDLAQFFNFSVTNDHVVHLRCSSTNSPLASITTP